MEKRALNPESEIAAGLRYQVELRPRDLLVWNPGKLKVNLWEYIGII